MNCRELGGSSRRDFLIRSFEGASALFVPSKLWNLSASANDAAFQPSSAPEFHLRPHYRAHLPIESTLGKVEAGSDDFITEKYAEQIQAILDGWSSHLRESPQSVDAVEKVLADNFSGSSLTPSESRKLRSGMIEIWKNSFSLTSLTRDLFLQGLRAALSGFAQVRTAEFQIVRIEGA